jgi:hypothetical protein
MKFIAGLIFSLFLFASSAFGAFNIHVEWNPYTPPLLTTVSGFKLYQEDVYVCETKIPTATSMDCTVNITKLATSYTLTAAFSDGKESPKSVPYVYNYTPVLVAPTIQKITGN